MDELLLRLYYLYEKSSKKCRELEEVAASLRHSVQPHDLPVSGGSRPLRACGTRFVSHKVAAPRRVVDRLGVYISHLKSLVDDPAVKPADKAKPKGYIREWSSGKILYSCAFFHDLLLPAAILCKSLQADEAFVVSSIEALLTSVKTIDAIKSSSFADLPR